MSVHTHHVSQLLLPTVFNKRLPRKKFLGKLNLSSAKCPVPYAKASFITLGKEVDRMNYSLYSYALTPRVAESPCKIQPTKITSKFVYTTL